MDKKILNCPRCLKKMLQVSEFNSVNFADNTELFVCKKCRVLGKICGDKIDFIDTIILTAEEIANKEV